MKLQTSLIRNNVIWDSAIFRNLAYLGSEYSRIQGSYFVSCKTDVILSQQFLFFHRGFLLVYARPTFYICSFGNEQMNHFPFHNFPRLPYQYEIYDDEATTFPIQAIDAITRCFNLFVLAKLQYQFDPTKINYDDQCQCFRTMEFI
jgi:hypothetical protein